MHQSLPLALKRKNCDATGAFRPSCQLPSMTLSVNCKDGNRFYYIVHKVNSFEYDSIILLQFDSYIFLTVTWRNFSCHQKHWKRSFLKQVSLEIALHYVECRRNRLSVKAKTDLVLKYTKFYNICAWGLSLNSLQHSGRYWTNITQ